MREAGELAEAAAFAEGFSVHRLPLMTSVLILNPS